MTDRIRTHAPLALLLALFFILGLLRLNDLSLYTDSTRYVIWGNSIAHGKGWIDDTQPVPESYVVNAPLFPVILAPVFLLAPLSLTAAKVWTLLWGVLALALFHRWLMQMLGRTPALVGTLLLAFNPMTIVLSTEVLSEAPFLAILAGTLLLLERVTANPADRRSFGLLVGLMAAVILLREVAITLVGAVVLLFFIRREPRRALMIIGAAVGVYGLWLFRNLVLVGTPPTSQSTNLQFIFQRVLTTPDAPLAAELLSRVWLNLRGFGFQLAGLLFYSVPTTLIVAPSEAFRTIVSGIGTVKPLIFLVVTPLMIAGLVLDLRRSPSAAARLLFLLSYLAIILTYPIHDVRFMLPVLPFMIFYSLRAIRAILSLPYAARIPRPAWLPVTTAVVLMIPDAFCLSEILTTNLSYRKDPVAFHERTSRTSPRRTFFSEPWIPIGDWIRANIPEDAIIACSAKEVVPFISPRKVLEINDGVPLPLFETMLRDNAAGYLLAVGIWGNITSYEFVMSESRRYQFIPVYSVANLRLFRIESRLLTPRERRIGWTFQYDSTSAAGLVRKGRWEMLQKRYAEAESSYARALRLMPEQPLILYQQLLLHTFREDSIASVRTLEQMFTAGGATTYLWAGRIYVDALNTLLHARHVSLAQQRAVQMFDIARLYWNYGYPFQSYRLIRDVVRSDSTYFVGLLWAWHYGTQLGDSVSPGRWLKLLEAIDRANPIVQSFGTITALQAALRHENDPLARAAIRLRIAAEYDKVDLPEEGLDEAERAISESPAHPESWMAYGAMLERRGKPFAAARAYRNAAASDPRNGGAANK